MFDFGVAAYFVALFLLILFARLKIDIFLNILCVVIFYGFFSRAGVFEMLTIFLQGVQTNIYIAVEFIFLGFFAVLIEKTGVDDIFLSRVMAKIKSNRFSLIGTIAGIVFVYETILPIHLLALPNLLPPLEKMIQEERIAAEQLYGIVAFGLLMGLVALPIGYGHIFNLVANQCSSMVNSTFFPITKNINRVIIFLVLAAGFLFSQIFPLQNKTQQRSKTIILQREMVSVKITGKHIAIIALVFLVAIGQLIFNVLWLWVLLGGFLLLALKIIEVNDLNYMVQTGIQIGAKSFVAVLAAFGLAKVLLIAELENRITEFLLSFCGNNFILVIILIATAALIIAGSLGKVFAALPILFAIFFQPLTHFQMDKGVVFVFLTLLTLGGVTFSQKGDIVRGLSGTLARGKYGEKFISRHLFLTYGLIFYSFSLLLGSYFIKKF